MLYLSENHSHVYSEISANYIIIITDVTDCVTDIPAKDVEESDQHLRTMSLRGP